MITTGTGEETAMVTVTEMITGTDEEIMIEMTTDIEETTTGMMVIGMVTETMAGVTTNTIAAVC